MILISNHLLHTRSIKIQSDAVIRINIAWVESLSQLKEYLNIGYDICIDYPEGRAKPPLPKMYLSEVIEIIKDVSNVKYLAISNVESENIAMLYKNIMPKSISFIPKIETATGINNLIPIIKESKPEYIMFDSEDLFTNVKGDRILYKELKIAMYRVCGMLNVKILELQGVVFSDEI